MGKKEQQTMQEIHDLLSHQKNFGAYRAALREAKLPCIPFLGLYLTDLTFIEDGNKDFLGNGDFINFDKRLKFSKVVLELHQFQKKPFVFQPIKQLQVDLSSCALTCATSKNKLFFDAFL